MVMFLLFDNFDDRCLCRGCLRPETYVLVADLVVGLSVACGVACRADSELQGGSAGIQLVGECRDYVAGSGLGHVVGHSVGAV